MAHSGRSMCRSAAAAEPASGTLQKAHLLVLHTLRCLRAMPRRQGRIAADPSDDRGHQQREGLGKRHADDSRRGECRLPDRPGCTTPPQEGNKSPQSNGERARGRQGPSEGTRRCADSLPQRSACFENAYSRNGDSHQDVFFSWMRILRHCRSFWSSRRVSGTKAAGLSLRADSNRATASIRCNKHSKAKTGRQPQRGASQQLSRIQKET